MSVGNRSLLCYLIGELEAYVRSLRAVLNCLVNKLDGILRRSCNLVINLESEDVGRGCPIRWSLGNIAYTGRELVLADRNVG